MTMIQIPPGSMLRSKAEDVLASLNAQFKLGFSYLATMAPEDQPGHAEHWIHIAAIANQPGAYFQVKIAFMIDAEKFNDNTEQIVASIGLALAALGVEDKETN